MYCRLASVPPPSLACLSVRRTLGLSFWEHTEACSPWTDEAFVLSPLVPSRGGALGFARVCEYVYIYVAQRPRVRPGIPILFLPQNTLPGQKKAKERVWNSATAWVHRYTRDRRPIEDAQTTLSTRSYAEGGSTLPTWTDARCTWRGRRLASHVIGKKANKAASETARLLFYFPPSLH